MRDSEVCSRYSRALLGLCKSDAEVQDYDRDFLKVAGLLKRHPEISRLALNSTIGRTEKEDFIDKVFASDVNRVLIHFLKVLIRKGRFRQVGYIQEEFHKRAELHRGIQEVRVVTAVPLPAAAEKKLTAALYKKLGMEIRLLAEVDASIVGGMVLRFDGTEINTSFRHRLDEIRQSLMK